MSNPRAELYDKVSGADIDAIAFQDPLRDETRKAKRNLVAASFAAILIAAPNLQVEGFLGLKTADARVLAAAATHGLACLAVIYFLVAFLLGFFVDYNAWRFEQERLLVKPYLELIKMAEQAFFALTEQIRNAMHYLHGQPLELEKITDPVPCRPRRPQVHHFVWRQPWRPHSMQPCSLSEQEYARKIRRATAIPRWIQMMKSSWG